MMKIQNIHAHEILDSNGNPTISTEIELWSGDKGTAEVPSGASTGKTEVLEMRDGDKDRYNGRGVLQAVEIINTTIKEAIIDKEFLSQKEFDDLLIKIDGTELKTKFGGNTILSCSMAFCNAVANSIGLELYQYIAMIYWDKEYSKDKLVLPTPQILVLEGGRHGNWATDIQEYMIVPNIEKFTTFSDQLRVSEEVYKEISNILKKKEYSTGIGYEGAFAPKEIQGNKEAFEILMAGIEGTGFKPGDDFTIAIDVASSEFFNVETQKYELKRENLSLDSSEWSSLQKEWYAQYPISSIEDLFDQEDWNSWSRFVEELGDKYQIVGDDLLTTNIKRITKGLERKSMNAVLIKLNQIGTVSETLDAIRMTVDNGMDAIISHRGGETNDTFIADLVVGTPAQFCKFGALNRGERIAKYNRVMKIEREEAGGGFKS
ncbi:MAG: phosphopyruvate hydratase [Candidatus Dojkabacteria bacterium]